MDSGCKIHNKSKNTTVSETQTERKNGRRRVEKVKKRIPDRWTIKMVRLNGTVLEDVAMHIDLAVQMCVCALER